MENEPSLAEVQVDLGTAVDGSLEIWVDGASYSDVSSVPNEKLRPLIEQAIKEWEAYNS